MAHKKGLLCIVSKSQRNIIQNLSVFLQLIYEVQTLMSKAGVHLYCTGWRRKMKQYERCFCCSFENKLVEQGILNWKSYKKREHQK